MVLYYGVSTGNSGYYGVGDIFTGTLVTKKDDSILLDGEEVFSVFYIKDNKIVYKK